MVNDFYLIDIILIRYLIHISSRLSSYDSFLLFLHFQTVKPTAMTTIPPTTAMIIVVVGSPEGYGSGLGAGSGLPFPHFI